MTKRSIAKKLKPVAFALFMAIVAGLIYFVVTYNMFEKKARHFVSENQAEKFLVRLGEDKADSQPDPSLKDATSLLHRLLNTLQPDDKKWISILVPAEGKTTERANKLGQELEFFGFPLLEQMNLMDQGSPLFYTANRSDRDKLVFTRMTMLRKLIVAWAKLFNSNERAGRYLLITAKAIRKPVFPEVYELQLSFVEEAEKLLGDNPRISPLPSKDFLWASLLELIEYRQYTTANALFLESTALENGERPGIFARYTSYRASVRTINEYENYKNRLTQIRNTARLTDDFTISDPTLMRLFSRVLELTH